MKVMLSRKEYKAVEGVFSSYTEYTHVIAALILRGVFTDAPPLGNRFEHVHEQLSLLSLTAPAVADFI